MSRFFLARYVSAWTLRKGRDEQRIAELRRRDGDDCRRCRRPLRFDLPEGHDRGPRVEAIAEAPHAKRPPLDSLCLTHRRCNAAGADHTDEVTERIRRKSEAALLSRSRQRKRKSA